MPIEEGREVDSEYNTMLRIYTAMTDKLMKNLYTDLEAIETRLDDRIDSLEKRSDEAIKSLATVLAQELGKFVTEKISEQLSGHAADWSTTMDHYELELAQLHKRLNSARERGTGGVQDCMKLLSELRADMNQRFVNITKSVDMTDDMMDEADDELRAEIATLRADFQEYAERHAEYSHGSVTARTEDPAPPQDTKDAPPNPARKWADRKPSDPVTDRLYAEDHTLITDAERMERDADILNANRNAYAHLMSQKDMQALYEIQRRLRRAADNLRS